MTTFWCRWKATFRITLSFSTNITISLVFKMITEATLIFSMPFCPDQNEPTILGLFCYFVFFLHLILKIKAQKNYRSKNNYPNIKSFVVMWVIITNCSFWTLVSLEHTQFWLIFNGIGPNTLLKAQNQF